MILYDEWMNIIVSNDVNRHKFVECYCEHTCLFHFLHLEFICLFCMELESIEWFEGVTHVGRRGHRWSIFGHESQKFIEFTKSEDHKEYTLVQ